MKKFITGILLAISMFSFFILYTDYKEEQIFNMKNVEHHLDNSYNVTIPSKINSLPRGQQHEQLIEASKGDDTCLYFTRIDQSGDNQKIIKYIYTSNNDYVSYFNLINGDILDYTLMDSNSFMSTKDTGDPNQIGQIASFDGIELEIRTLQNMVEDGFLLDGSCTVTVADGKSIDLFTDIFKVGLGINTMDVSTSYDIGEIENTSYFQIPVLFLIFMMLILYYIIKSYKKIAVEKLLGFSIIDIWKTRIVKILKIQLITIILAIVSMSIILFKDFNILYIDFLKYISMRYIGLVVITLIIASIPFIYVENIKVSSVLKNKRQVKEIIIINNIIKITLCIIFIFLVNIQIINYDDIKKIFNNEYKAWEDVSDYRVLSLNRIDSEQAFSNEFLDNNIELYKYFNNKGAIFAEFEMYSNLSKEMNSTLPEYLFRAVVNHNYLINNPVYDINHNLLSISEENTNWVLLVPEKYKNNENDIRTYYQQWINSYNGVVTSEVELVWIENDQKLFSYNFLVNTNDGNYVTDPILFIGSEKGCFPDWNTQVFNIMGNPLKVKIENGSTDIDTIMPILDEYGYSSYGVQINYANEQVISSYNDFKSMFKWIVTGIVSSIIIIGLILVQNTYTFVEQFKVRFALRKLHGYSLTSKYKEYFILVAISWIIIILISYLLQLSQIYIILCISLIGCIIELVISLIILRFFREKKIIEFIKGGI